MMHLIKNLNTKQKHPIKSDCWFLLPLHFKQTKHNENEKRTKGLTMTHHAKS